VALSQLQSAPNSFSAAPDPLRELTALHRPPSWFKGALLLSGRGGEGKGEEGKGGEGEGRLTALTQIPGSALTIILQINHDPKAYARFFNITVINLRNNC